MIWLNKIVVLLLMSIINTVLSYKPVVLLHGILTGSDSMLFIKDEIQLFHPGTKIYLTDRFSGWSSLENAWHQVNAFGNDLMKICKKHPDGVHAVGYSQGGLIGRAVLQAFPNHCVKYYISLSSPQAGQFGTAFLHLIFPNLVAKTAYQLFYTYVGQHTSVANYWNDPHKQDLYYEFSQFLPFINNEILSKNSSDFRRGILKLDKLILIGGPHDGVITPWQSSHFSYYDGDDEIIPYYRRDVYRNDSIGLRTLHEQNKLFILTYPNVQHREWHLNPLIIYKSIIKHLD